MLRESYVKGKAAELMVSWLIGWLVMRIGTAEQCSVILQRTCYISESFERDRAWPCCVAGFGLLHPSLDADHHPHANCGHSILSSTDRFQQLCFIQQLSQSAA